MAEPTLQIEKIFEEASTHGKTIIAAIAGLVVVMESKLEREVKFDAMKEIVNRLSAEMRLVTIQAVVECCNDTGAAVGDVMEVMHRNAWDENSKATARLKNIMQLFIDEAKSKRNGGGNEVHLNENL